MMNRRNKRKTGYKNPVSFEDSCVKTLEFLSICFKEIRSNESKFKGKEIKTFEISKVLCPVNLTYDELLETYMLPDAEEQFITQELKNVKNVSLNREMLFDRRFTETVAPLPGSANGAH